MSHATRISIKDIISRTYPDRVYVIAEIGSNHDADLQQALRYIDACADAGADAVKFQSWTTADILNSVDPVTQQNHPAYPILARYELPTAWHHNLKQRCDERGVDFLSTPFDIGKARVLKDMEVTAIKIASGDLTYHQLLHEVDGYGLPILLSTGMANNDEIAQALNELHNARQQTILLHCVGAYPPDIADANLRAITSLAETFRLPVGISDHYPGNTTVIAAIALGARVVEKHVTFSRKAGTPDSPFALEMDEFKAMVEHIRQLELALGDGLKHCRPSETGGISGGRRSLYWRMSLPAGECVSESHLAILRPNSGEYQPADLQTLIGCTLGRAVKAHQPVSRMDFESDR